jgi:hypothetical protein
MKWKISSLCIFHRSVLTGNVLNIYRDTDGVPSHWVYFKLEDGKITVMDSDGITFEATVMLNDMGDCKPKINGQERELWQMRRTALEKLFFAAT